MIAVLLVTTVFLGPAAPGSAGAVRPAPQPSRAAEPAGFGWPLEPHEIARPFQAPAYAYGPGHRGVDLVGTVGQPVLAAGSGMVVYAGRLADRDVVSLEHAGALRTTYEPVAATVRVGQRVLLGQEIGRLEPGHPACTVVEPAACLHWGARRDGSYLDPLRLVKPGKLRLFPWRDPTA